MDKETVLDALLQAYIQLAKAYTFIKFSGKEYPDPRLDGLAEEVWKAQETIHNIRNEAKKGDK